MPSHGVAENQAVSENSPRSVRGGRHMGRSRVAMLWVSTAYVVGFTILDLASHVRPQLGPGITAWDPQAGLTLVYLLETGPFGILLTTTVALIEHWARQGLNAPGLATLAILLNSLALAGLAAFVRRAALAPPWNAVEVSGRFISACAVACGSGAFAFCLTFALGGSIAIDDLLTATFRLGFAQLTGILTMAPLMLALLARPSLDALPTRAWKSRIAFIQMTTLALLLATLLTLAPAWQLRFFYLLLIPIVWIALRWTWLAALAAVLVIHLALVGAVKLQLHTPRFIDLQVLMLTLALVAIVLGMAVQDRLDATRRAQERDAALSRGLRVAMANGLASALAHELNQPITALVSYLRSVQILATASTPDVPLLQLTVSKAVEEALRTSAILRRLRDFYRNREIRREIVVLDTTCANVAATLEPRLRASGARLTLQLAASRVTVTADRTHLEIVLFNLLSNALDAVTAAHVRPREMLLCTRVVGAAVQVSIEDSGQGVADELAARLFEPFVTSKRDGMGLGLSISRELTRQFGGELHVTRSAALGGAAFTLYLERR